MSNKTKTYKNSVPKIYLMTFGCQMNERDSELVLGQFLSRGYQITKNFQDANVILFNTCSVRQHAEDKVWSELGRLKKLFFQSIKFKNRQRPIIGVIGCMAKNIGAEIIKRNPWVDLVCSPNDLADLYNHIDQIQKTRNPIVAISSQTRKRQFYKYLFHQDKSHCYVNISEGCSNFCSYCIVPYVRGYHRSRPLYDILEEIRGLVNNGINSITLLGQNVNDYSYSIGDLKMIKKINFVSPKFLAKNSINFVDLLSIVSQIEAIVELSFVTSHPKDIDLRLFDLMAEKSNIKKFLHLPVQSGSNKILRAMNRKYTREKYLRIVEMYRKRVPKGVLATDIIVGFPGETDKDFRDTLDLIKSVRFNFAYIFKYSPRPHTAAEKLPDDVPFEEKKRRHRILLETQKEISRQLAGQNNKKESGLNFIPILNSD